MYSEWRGSWNGMYDGRDGLSVWADTAWISTGEGSLMEMPRSVESSWIEEGRARGWTYGGRNGLRWVCTYGTSHPGRWSAQGIGRYCLWNVWVYVWNWKGKVPRSSRAELKVDRELRTSGQTEYGTTCLGQMDGISVVMRWVYAAENYPGRRSVRCKQGIGRWNMQTVGAWHWTCWLADLNTTVGGHARCAACVCHIGLLFGKCFWIGKVQQHHRIGSRTNLQVGVLSYCSFVGYRNRFCI